MRALEFGWFMPSGAVPGKDETTILEEESQDVLPAVAEHFDSIWMPDHFYAFGDPTDAWLECWTALTWLAARYPRVKVGPIVLGVGYRQPALLAKMASSLQTLSGGRFIMGTGAGWREPEYLAYGYPFPRPAQRIRQLEEAVQIMRLMWTQPWPSFDGRYFQIKDAYCEPRPRIVPPIMIGGGGEQLLLPLAGRLADIWDRYHGTSLEEIDLQGYARKLAIVRRSAAEAGRDPASIVQSFSIENEHLPATQEASTRWLEHLRPLVDLGVRQFILGFGRVTDPQRVRRFAEEVIAPLRVTIDDRR